MIKRIISCQQCGSQFKRDRRTQKYCSEACRVKSFSESTALAKSGRGSGLPAKGDLILAGGNAVVYKNGILTTAFCAVCRGRTTQQFIDSLTPVYHSECMGEEPEQRLPDRTHLFPAIYGSKPTATIFGKFLGGNLATP